MGLYCMLNGWKYWESSNYKRIIYLTCLYSDLSAVKNSLLFTVITLCSKELFAFYGHYFFAFLNASDSTGFLDAFQ